MKTIIIASLISLIVVVGGYVFYLKQSIGRAVSEPAEQIAYSEEDMAAVEFAVSAVEVKRREALELEAELKVLRSQIASEKSALRIEEERLEKLIGQLTVERDNLAENQDQALTRLAKVYEMMKPVEAAEIASDLSIDLLVEIIPRMKDRAAAKLIAALDTSKAVQITQRLGYAIP